MQQSLRKRLKLLLIVPAVFFCLWTAVNSYAAEPEPAPRTETGVAEPEPAPAEKAETAEPEPEPAPRTATGALEGEGTLSRPSEASSDSIFGSDKSEEIGTDEKMQALIPQIQASLPTGNGSWSVYVYDTVNVSEGSINSWKMQAASLIKLFIMGAVYENFDSLAAQYGQETLESNLYSMITVSDNDAANNLTAYLGAGDSEAGRNAVDAFCKAHGYESTHMGRMLLQSNEYDDNFTSVSDCGHFLKDIYEQDYEEFPYADEMFELLANQTRRHKIPAQMPEGVSVANKTGELSNVENDAGIIYDTENDLVLVFMSENLSEVGTAQNTIASISRKIYDYYNLS